METCTACILVVYLLVLYKIKWISVLQILKTVHVCFYDVIHNVSSYTELLVVFILEALKSVFFGASLAHFEETGAPVGGKRQLLQHDVLRYAHFLPKLHLCIWTVGDKNNKKKMCVCVCVFSTAIRLSDKTFILQIPITLSLNTNTQKLKHNAINTSKQNKKKPLCELLTWYSCQYDERGIIFPRDQLMFGACFAVCSACELLHADHGDVTGLYPSVRHIICQNISQLSAAFRPLPFLTQLSWP